MARHVRIFVGSDHGGLERRAEHYESQGWTVGPITIAANILQALLPESLRGSRVDVRGSLPCVNGVTKRALSDDGVQSVHINLRSITTLEKRRSRDTLQVRARHIRQSLREEGLDHSDKLHVHPRGIWKDTDY